MSTSDSTIPAWLFRNARERPAAPALRFHAFGKWIPVDWRQLGLEIGRTALALRGLGVARGDRVALIAENRCEWILFDQALMLLGAVHVPIHISLSGEQMAYQAAHSESRLIAFAGREQADKLAPCAEALPAGARLVVLDAWDTMSRHPLAGRTCTYASLFDDDPAPETTSLVDLLDEFELPQADDPATIMYTSGTTGVPRGVVLSHGNLSSNAAGASQIHVRREDELRLIFLPLSHVYARTCDMYTWIHRGTELALARSRETIIADSQELRPTLINGVPYFFEKLCSHLKTAGKLDEPGAINSLLGGRVESCFSGGAALPEYVWQVFARQGMEMLQGYGLSESSPVISASTRAANKPGTVGKAIDRVEIKIADDGEILTRGPHVMLGYWKDEQATRAAIIDGWLHTGDLGQLDEEGFLTITGRKKELIVMALGKNVVPTHLEGLLTASPLIEQALVVGEGRKVLSALIVPNAEQFGRALKLAQVHVASPAEALVHPRVLEIYRTQLDRALAGVSQHEQIGPFRLLPRGFSLDEGELTPKGSLRRTVIAEHFSAEIEQLYE